MAVEVVPIVESPVVPDVAVVPQPTENGVHGESSVETLFLPGEKPLSPVHVTPIVDNVGGMEVTSEPDTIIAPQPMSIATTMEEEEDELSASLIKPATVPNKQPAKKASFTLKLKKTEK